MTTTTTYRHLDPTQARAAIGTLKPVYAATFSEPPYNEGPEMAEKFVSWVNDESTRDGFTMWVAYQAAEPVGFSYGYTMPAGEWFRRTDRPAPPEIKAAPKFAVMEWAVRPDRRRQGVGGQLMRHLLRDRPEPWAVLTVNPAAAAHDIYRQAGWRQIAATKPSRDWPAMAVMVLNLSGVS